MPSLIYNRTGPFVKLESRITAQILDSGNIRPVKINLPYQVLPIVYMCVLHVDYAVFSL